MKPHAVFIPLPAQGHVTPMMTLAKLFHCRGFHITFVNTEFNHQRLINSRGPDSVTGLPDFRFETISDGLPPPGDSNAAQNVPDLFNALRYNMLLPFRKLIKKLNNNSQSSLSLPSVENILPPVACIVISDGMMSFALKVGRELGIPVALFWTASVCGLNSYLNFAQLVERVIMTGRDETRGHRQARESQYVQSVRDIPYTSTCASVPPSPSCSLKRPAEKELVILRPPPKDYMMSKHSYRGFNLEEFKAKHGLQEFEVRLFGDEDDLTYDMIANYKYDSQHLLTTVGQLESGLRLPLYRTDDTFVYDVLSSRDKAEGSSCRSIVQYNGNFYRVLDECRLRAQGKTRLTCYTPNPDQRSWYTSDNFHATYKDYMSAGKRKKWSVSLARRKLTPDQIRAGKHLLLEEVDKIKIKWVPGTEDRKNPVYFPREQKLREDHEFRWHRTPIEIIGPWAWGWSPNKSGQYRLSAPKRYGDYCPWLLDFTHFDFEFSREEQYDFSEKDKVAKKPRVSHLFSSVDGKIPRASSSREPDDDESDDCEEDDVVQLVRKPRNVVFGGCDLSPPATIIVEGKVGESSHRTPSPATLVGDIGNTTVLATCAGPSASQVPVVPSNFEGPNISSFQTARLGTTAPGGPCPTVDPVQMPATAAPLSSVVVDPTSSTLPPTTDRNPRSWPTFELIVESDSEDEVSLIRCPSPVASSVVVEEPIDVATSESAPVVMSSVAQKGDSALNPKVANLVSESPHVVTSVISTEVGSSSGLETSVRAEFGSNELAHDKVIYKWAFESGLLSIPPHAPSVIESSMNAGVPGKMRVPPHEPLVPTRSYTVAEKQALSEARSYYFPQFSSDAIVEDSQFLYEMYQLEKLKAAKYEALFRASDSDLVAKVEEVRVLQEQHQEDLKLGERVQILEKEVRGLEKRHQEDLKLGDRVKDLEQEVVDLRGQVDKLKVDLDETVQKAQQAVGNLSAAEAIVTRLKAQVEAHDADVAQLQLEARDRYAHLVNSFLAKVKEDTGKTYKLKL